MTHELFTSCTACGAVFEITLEQLSVANGAVRCGVCGTTFNARESLRETADLDSELAASVEALEASIAADDEALISAPAAQAPPASDPPAPESDSTSWPTGDGVDDTPTQSGGEEFIDIGLPTGVQAPIDDPADADSPTAGADQEALEDLLDTSQPRRSLVSSLAWGFAGTLLLAVALVQVTVYWRHQLVQIAWLNGPLVNANAALGSPLEFSYDVERYRFVDRPRLLVDAVGTDVPAEDEGRVLEVRAELANDAQVPQPLPHLRLILEDRWGRPVASRTLPPAEYLAERRPAKQFLQPDERVRASARVATRENIPQAYTLDICLPAGLGQLDCGDAPTQR